MAKYIELEAAVKAFNNFDAGRADSPPFTLLTPEEFAEYLYELPTVDVAPVMHSYWEHKITSDEENINICHNCKYPVSRFWGTTNYCPNCGAKMDVAKNNSNEVD